MNERKKDYLVLVPLSYCFSIPFFIEFVREAIHELGEDLQMDILLFRGSEPAAPDLLNHPGINLIEIGGLGKLRYIYCWFQLITLLFRK